MNLKRTKGDYEVMSDKLTPLNLVKAMMSMERLCIEVQMYSIERPS